MSISNKAAICDKVSKLGCTSLVHQRETVVSFLSSVWASHLLVLPCSTSTTFNLFIGFFGIIICVWCKYTYFRLCFFIRIVNDRVKLEYGNFLGLQNSYSPSEKQLARDDLKILFSILFSITYIIDSPVVLSHI